MKKLLPIILAGFPLAAQAQTDTQALGLPTTLQEVSLPERALELVAFHTRNASATEVAIVWATMNERHGEFFFLERSGDLKQWEILFSEVGTGGPTLHTAYEWVDSAPLEGTSYYRLMSPGDDGLVEISDLSSVHRPREERLRFTPDDLTSARFIVSAQGQLSKVAMLNNRGQFIPMNLETQNGKVIVDASLLEPGTYIVQAEVDGHPVMKPVVVTPTGIIGG